MPRKSPFRRTLASFILFLFAVTAMPTAALAQNATGPQEIAGTADLYKVSAAAAEYEQANQIQTVAAAQPDTGTDQQAAGSMQKGNSGDCCGGFWEVHFGGYRWAWWALAGAGLIAIHAN